MKKLVSLLAASAVLFANPALAGTRSYTIDDALGLERMGTYYGGACAFSPDGGTLAFRRIRPHRSAPQLLGDSVLWDNPDGGDVWLHADGDDKPSALTDGAADGSGWWAPAWSPDGRRLAMLSTRGGSLRIWLWDARSRKLAPLSAREVEINGPQPQPFLWLDNESLIYPAVPEGQRPQIEVDTPRLAGREWAKAAAGKQATASVLDSGVTPDLSKRPQGQLRLISAASGAETVMAEASSLAWTISPTGKAVAFARETGIYTPKAGQPWPLYTYKTFGLGLAALDGTAMQVAGELPRDILPDSLRWSPDGDELVFLGWEKGRSVAPRLFRLALAERRVAAQQLDALDAAPVTRERSLVEWTASGLLLAAVRPAGARAVVGERRDIWLLRDDGTSLNLTADLKTAPQELWRERDGLSFVGLADGELWRLDPAARQLENLSSDFAAPIERLVEPTFDEDGGFAQWPQPGRGYASIAFAVHDGAAESFYRLNLASARIETVKAPAAGAKLICDSGDGTAVFHRADARGLNVWRVSAQGKTRELIVANQFLRDIRPGQAQMIEYTSLDGEPFKAWLLLPPDYKKGQRLPLLTRVYASYVAGPEVPFDIADGGYLNMQIPAARGYAVLMPSMPLPAAGAADPLLALQSGVLPAIDKIVQLGIADEKRLFLMGQSYGGFATNGLITLTHRFAAAVSLAGVSDWTALHLATDETQRYRDDAHERLLQDGVEAILGAGPPWTDLHRYMRNSPLYQVDRVRTPLMLIHGDFDRVPIQQSEAFFNSLYRQGKRARFVRYWGEGHVLRSPANVRDMWERVFSWFEEFSPATSEPSQQSPRLR